MGILRDLYKKVKSHHVIAVFGLIVLVAAMYQYSSGKSMTMDGMRDTRMRSSVNQQSYTPDDMGSVAQPADPIGMNEVYADVSGMSTQTRNLPPSCMSGSVTDPGDLLPKDVNSEWSRLNPNGNNDLANVNLLKAGYHTGIDTVGSSLRNANLQVRSEPPNPTRQVSPWMNSTIEPDLMRVPLELGCGSQ
jgi:hypothetical protein